MELFISDTSPYSRRILLLADRLGLLGKFSVRTVAPFENPEDLIQVNPLCRVPVLVTEEGLEIAGSLVIAMYMLEHWPNAEILPVTGWSRWQILANSALVEGIIDASYQMVLESRRPAAMVSEAVKARYATAIDRSLGRLAEIAPPSREEISFYEISLGCALGYLSFRLPSLYQRMPTGLQAWGEWFASLPWVKATIPCDPH